MATDFLNLFDGASQGKTLSSVSWNDVVNAIDRAAQGWFRANIQGPMSGWALPETSTVSQVTRGSGFIGPQFVQTTASTTISGLQAGTNYVHIVATTSSGWAGTIAAKARTTSAPLTNPDGTSKGIILGTVGWAASTGVQESSVNSALRQPAFPLRGHKQGIAVSLTAAASSVASAAYAFSTVIRMPSLSALISVGTSQYVSIHTVTQSGFVAALYNADSNAGTETYSKTLQWEGFLR